MNSAISNHWDFIIVGARCAGATLATLLARKGFKVLMLDSSARGSNKAMSTHAIRPQGIKVLERLGLESKLKENLIMNSRFRVALNDTEILADIDPDYPAYNIRRHVIDSWLQDTALESGVEFLDNHRVTELTYTGDRVSGVITKSEHGVSQYSANWIIGADGAHSSIAKLVGAKEYLASDETERAGYWAYFKQPDPWPHPWDTSLEYRGDDFFFVFPCDGNLVLLAYGSDRERMNTWGKNKEELLLEALRKSPSTAPLVKDNNPTSRVYGVANSHFYYRKPYGPGYALVGDAGHYVHYSTGYGMSNAFCDAEKLSVALADGRPEALEYFWRQRDADSIAIHFDANNQAKISNNNVMTREMYNRINRSPELRSRVNLMLQGRLALNEMIPRQELVDLIKTAIRERRFDIVKEFLKFAPTQLQQELIIKQFERKRRKAFARLSKLTPQWDLEPKPRYSPPHKLIR